MNLMDAATIGIVPAQLRIDCECPRDSSGSKNHETEETANEGCSEEALERRRRPGLDGIRIALGLDLVNRSRFAPGRWTGGQ